MASFNEPVRTYKFSDARLIEIANEKIAFARRDATELATVGITAGWVDSLEELVTAFLALPSDEVELGEQEEATDIKDSDADQLRDKLKELRSAAVRAFGEKHGDYKQFALKGIDKMKDDDLLKAGVVALGVAVTHAVPLATKGWDAADNTALQTLIDDFGDSLTNKSIEVGSRDSATENRIIKGNELYTPLEKELCEAGKAYWRTISEAKYNDYVIYDTPSGGGGVTFPQFFEGDLAMGNIASFDLANLDIEHHPLITFIFENLSTSLFRFYAAASPTDAPGAGAVLDVFPSTAVPKTIAELIALLGFNDTKHYLNVYNAGPLAAHFKVIIENP